MARFSKNIHYIILIWLIIIGFGLRFAYLDRDMRYDESLTVFQYASKSIPTIVGDYSMMNNHILHNLLVHFSFHYLGQDPIFVRLPVFIAGVLLIPMIFVVASRFYDRIVGLLTASLLAVYPILIDFSVNARAYSILALIVTWMLILAYDLREKDNTSKWLLLSVLSAAGFLAVPTMLYAMGIIALWLLTSIWMHQRGELRTILLKNYVVSMSLGAILTILFYTPVLVFNNGLAIFTENGWTEPLPPAEFYVNIDHVLVRIWQNAAWAVPDSVVFVLSVGFLLSLLAHSKFNKKRLPLLPFVIVWVLSLLLIQRVNPFRRTWLFLVPIWLMLSASGLVYLLDRLKIKSMAVIAGICFVFSATMATYILQTDHLITSRHTVRAMGAEEAAIMLNDLMTSDDRVILGFPYSYAVLYYSQIYDFPLGDNSVEPVPDETIAQSDAQVTYLYVLYLDADEIDFQVEFFSQEELENAEIVARWGSAILRRLVITED